MLLVVGFVNVSSVFAGMIEMPEIVEAPEMETKTMVRDIDIPSVSRRSVDPLSGPRLAVSEFRIQGLIEYPELGITKQALAEMVEEIRADLMDEGEHLPSGYTVEELSELSDLLVDIEDETQERHVTTTDVQRLVWLVRDQRSKRGILLSQIESVADRITQFYRERGFILAKAYIPKQKVRDGVVNLTLLIGVLGEVEVHNNELYSDEQIFSVFEDMYTKPVTSSRVEENLYLINDFPGVVVDGYFEQGYQVGDTRLNINVKNEDRFNYNVRLDNHGTDQTGLYRLYADMQANNIVGKADSLKLSLLHATQPSNTEYWRMNYQMSLFSPRFKVGYGVSKNQFVVNQSSADGQENLHGVVNVRDIEGIYFLKRSRVKNYSLRLTQSDIVSDLQFGETDPGRKFDDELSNRSLQFDYDILQASSKILHQGNVKLTQGKFVFGVDDGQDESFLILGADYTALKFWQIPFFDAESRVIFRASAQYSGINLSSIVRFSVAGPSRVRGFQPNYYSADDAIYTGVDWVFNSPDILDVDVAGVNLQEFIKPVLFMDYGWGRQNALEISSSSASEPDVTGLLGDVGVGIQFSHGIQFRGNLQVAFPVVKKFSDSSVVPEEESMRVIFDLQYGF